MKELTLCYQYSQQKAIIERLKRALTSHIFAEQF